MAVLKYCPHCEQSQECTKKGFYADGEQKWICKVCGQQFKSITGQGKRKKVAAKKVVTQKTTEIIVNNNSVKTVPNFLTTDEAFDIVSSYFKEVAKENVEIKETGDKKIIKFKVKSGSKG